MKEGRAEACRIAGGDKMPKTENADSYRVRVTHVGLATGAGEPQEGKIQPEPETISRVTSSVQALNMNLSLTTPRKGKAVFDLNLEPLEEEVSLEIHHHRNVTHQTCSNHNPISYHTENPPSPTSYPLTLTKESVTEPGLSSSTLSINTNPNHPDLTEHIANPKFPNEHLTITLNPHPDLGYLNGTSLAYPKEQF